jgi:hypothetical protein
MFLAVNISVCSSRPRRWEPGMNIIQPALAFALLSASHAVIAPDARHRPAYTKFGWGGAKCPERGGLALIQQPDKDVVGPKQLAGRGKEGGMTNEAGGPWEEEVQVESIVAVELNTTIAPAAETATSLPRAELLKGVCRLFPC